jgi:hypothetical protein
MNLLRLLAASLTALALGGCAHQISVAPTAAMVRPEGSPPKIRENVGLFVPPEVAAIEVTTGGGGGDRVRYFPYRDIEAGYQAMLLTVFEGVTKLSTANDPAAMAKDNIKYVVTPSIVTTSGSTSAFTWPPTDFTVDLTTNVKDAQGRTVATKRAVGQGQAEWGEFTKLGWGLAGVRAMESALRKTQAELLTLTLGPAGSGTAATTAPSSTPSTKQMADRLAELKSLADSGLITPAEYEKKRLEMLNSL